MRGHPITLQSGRKLSKLLNEDRFQPPIHRDSNTRPVSSSGKNSRFCVLLEDMPSGHGSFAWARWSDWGPASKGDFKLYNWGNPAAPAVGIIDGARAGYWMTAECQNRRWRYEQGPCVNYCSSPGSIESGSPPPAVVDEPYAFWPISSGIEESTFILVEGPDWVTVDPDTGEISGTPPEGSAGTVLVIIAGDSRKTGTLTDELCRVTRAVPLNISPADV